jgi:hypothetical protein
MGEMRNTKKIVAEGREGGRPFKGLDVDGIGLNQLQKYGGKAWNLFGSELIPFTGSFEHCNGLSSFIKSRGFCDWLRYCSAIYPM